MRARTAGSGWEIFAPAKLNLYLEVLGRRDDGFHELETLMTPVRLFDRLTWTPSAPWERDKFSLEYDASTPAEFHAAAPTDPNNLAWRAFDLIARAAGIPPTGRAILAKRIPAQAGLGGASADAAAALVLANSAWDLNFPRARLARLAAELGSDVPFFLAGGAAICRGRGERVEPLAGLPRLDVVIIKPPQGVSTSAAFHSLDLEPGARTAAQNSQARLVELVDDLRRGALAHGVRRMFNRLEQAAARLCEGAWRLKDIFAACACRGSVMTGSGSAHFAVMRSARQARQLARLLSQRLEFLKLGSDSRGTGTAYVFATATYQAASPSL
jgi:4-diphosphocytidyl-2-C-methyl-D-erythritol kinase